MKYLKKFLPTLQQQMCIKFQEFRIFLNPFRRAENTWVVTAKDIGELTFFWS